MHESAPTCQDIASVGPYFRVAPLEKYIHNMYNSSMQFEWDEKKNQANQKKHKVSFEEAQTVFFDPMTKVASDPEHSGFEDRFIAVGHSSRRVYQEELRSQKDVLETESVS